MSLLGLNLTVLIGSTVPKPAPASLIDSLERVEVIQSDDGRSGFQIIFKAGRGEPFDSKDYPLLKSGLLKPFNRVILMLTFGVNPTVLMDGIITDVQFRVESTVGSEGEQYDDEGYGSLEDEEFGAAILTVTGEDVSVMMDLEEKIVEHPALDESMIARKILAKYVTYGVVPKVKAPPVKEMPLPTERVPVQHGTDLEYLLQMANRYGYIFYIQPGPAPAVNSAYWGPAKPEGKTQSALTINMGSATNLNWVNFRYDGLAAHTTMGRVQDRKTSKIKALKATKYGGSSLVKNSALRYQSKKRQTWFSQVAGLTNPAALARAKGSTDASVRDVVTAQGEVDSTRYGEVLQIRRLVGLRGVGKTFDGTYYVKRVTHIIMPKEGSYNQRFVLSRDGVGSKELMLI